MRAIPTTRPYYLPSLQHATLVLLDRVDDVPRFHGVAGVCSAGWAHDLTLFAGDDAEPADALDWARCLINTDLEVVRLVLLSAEASFGALAEADIEWFLEATDDCEYDGVELADWVRTDGSTVRSMASWCGTATRDWLA